MKIEIREGRVNDAGAIAAVHIASWKEGYKGIIHQSYLDSMRLAPRIEAWAQNLECGKTDQYKNFVALDGSVVVGFVDVGSARLSDMCGYGELYSIYVDPVYFGSGIGAQLFERAAQQALLFGYNKLYVWVLEHNKRGQDFYKSMRAEIVPDVYDEFLIGGRPYRDMQYHWADLRANLNGQ